MEEKWLSWAKQIQAHAQNGLAYAQNPFDRERYQQLRDLSVEIMQHYTEAGCDTITDLFCNETGYQTPKVDVRGAVFKDGKVLLVKERQDGKWSLPGGWADIGLSVKENVKKEVLEEAGMTVEPIRLVAILDWIKEEHRCACPFSMYKIFMLCNLVGGAYQENIETEDAQFFGMDELPELTHKISKEAIEMCYQAWCKPYWQPVVD